MNQELGHEPASDAIEIRCPLWQKLFVAPLVLFMCGCGVMGWICAICPQLLEHRPDKLPNVWERLFFLFGSPFMFGAGLYMCQTWFYRLRADTYGLTESLGYKETRVFWSDVASYSMEPSRQSRESRLYPQPVLRDARGVVLLRLVYPVLGSDQATLRRRVEFWRLVQSRLPGKDRPYVPLPLHPAQQNIWIGKSAEWKIRRVVLLALRTLSVIALWSAAMLWTMTQPTLPRYVAPLLGLSVLVVPLLLVIVQGLIIDLHRKRQERARRDEASTAQQVLEPPDLGIT